MCSYPNETLYNRRYSPHTPHITMFPFRRKSIKPPKSPKSPKASKSPAKTPKSPKKSSKKALAPPPPPPLTEDELRIQAVVQDSAKLARTLAEDPNIKDLVLNWKQRMESSSSNQNMDEIISYVSILAKELQSTESFLELLLEIRHTLFMLIQMEKDKVQTHVAQLKESQHIPSKDEYRARTVAELRNLIKVLSQNDIWSTLVDKGKRLKGEMDMKRCTSAPELVELETRLNRDLSASLRDGGMPKFSNMEKALQNAVGDAVDVAPFFMHARAAIEDIVNSHASSEIICNLRKTVNMVIDDPRLLDSAEVEHALEQRYKDVGVLGKRIADSEHVTQAKVESQKIFEALLSKANGGNADSTGKVMRDAKSLIRNLQSFNSSTALSPQFLNQLKDQIIPVLLEQFVHVGVPPIMEQTDSPVGKFQYELSNIHLSGLNVPADRVIISVKKLASYIDAQGNVIACKAPHLVLSIKATDIHIDLKDVMWKYKRQSYPRISDEGKANITTQGKGVTMRMKMDVLPSNRGASEHMISLRSSSCMIDGFKVHVVGSKHGNIYKIVMGIFASKIKKLIEETVVNKLDLFTDRFDSKLKDLASRSSSVSYSSSSSSSMASSVSSSPGVRAPEPTPLPDTRSPPEFKHINKGRKRKQK
eukprot:TRINITY_DN6317_c0_g1_i2.p1 TRINITY_DN6317_c0_g1~~TRINITY_DN6317_c0_g1_i2.p1  ORF type:complete len:647 (-),score=209.31 TRINITY_DN6317_c0_g1_i2:38-1978(-)